jgi:hypothetical protein
MATPGTTFTITTRFNSGNNGSYGGNTVVTPPVGGNNPQPVDQLIGIVSGVNQGGQAAGNAGGDLVLVAGAGKPPSDLGIIGRATTLGADITLATTTSITIAANVNIAAGAVLKIDTEQLLVTGVSGTTLTVQRAYNGTVAPTTNPSHASGVAVTPQSINTNGGGFGLSASLVTAGTAGNSFSVVVTFYKLNGVTTTAIKTYTLTDQSTSFARDAIGFNQDYGTVTSGDTLAEIDVTPDLNGAIVEITGLINWNS